MIHYTKKELAELFWDLHAVWQNSWTQWFSVHIEYILTFMISLDSSLSNVIKKNRLDYSDLECSDNLLERLLNEDTPGATYEMGSDTKLSASILKPGEKGMISLLTLLKILLFQMPLDEIPILVNSPHPVLTIATWRLRIER